MLLQTRTLQKANDYRTFRGMCRTNSLGHRQDKTKLQVR